MEPIKKCPFCGSRDIRTEAEVVEGVVLHYCSCFNCGCRTDSFADAEEAVEIWNGRV